MAAEGENGTNNFENIFWKGRNRTTKEKNNEAEISWLLCCFVFLLSKICCGDGREGDAKRFHLFDDGHFDYFDWQVVLLLLVRWRAIYPIAELIYCCWCYKHQQASGPCGNVSGIRQPPVAGNFIFKNNGLVGR